MRGIIEISEFVDCFDDYQITNAVEPFDYSWKLSFDVNVPFSHYFMEERREDAERGLQEGLDVLDCDAFNLDIAGFSMHKDEELIAYLKECRECALNTFRECEYVTFEVENEDAVRQYLEKNPELRSKYIVISHPNSEIDKDTLARIEKIYAGFTDRLMFDMKGNSKLVSYQECKRTVEMIEAMVERVQYYDFSPFEAVMYVYDQVRDREYSEEGEEEYSGVSRDLTSVLLGDKIVCTGFANILNAILSRLGFKSTTYHLVRKSDGRGHRRVAVYIEDDKYGIEGVYVLEPTWGSKKNGTDEFLYNYKYFARTKDQIAGSSQYVDELFGDFGEDYLKEFLECDGAAGLKSLPSKMIRDINNIALFLDHKRLIPLSNILSSSLGVKNFGDGFDHEEVCSRLEKYVQLLNRPLDSLVLLRALYNVRKIQYYENPERFPFSFEAFYKTYVNSGWGSSSKEEEILLHMMYGKDFRTKMAREFDELAKSEDLMRKIVMIKLARVLRSEVDKDKKMVLK